MPIPCYQYSKCLEYALTEDSQFSVVQGKMQGKMRKESTSWMLDQNIYGCSHTLRWLYCSGNEAEQLTLAMIWLQMSHDALPSLEQVRMGQQARGIWPFTWSSMPNFRPQHTKALTTHYTNERGYFTCCRGPRDWLVSLRRNPPTHPLTASSTSPHPCSPADRSHSG